MKPLELTFDKTDKLVELLKDGKIGVMPTDTIYGIVGSALNPSTIEEIYLIRKRDSSKPMIILISGLGDLKKFGIILAGAQIQFLKSIWPNPVSIVLPCPEDRFLYLHRGKKSLAFRVPKNKLLLEILKQAGPLVAPSANFANEPFVETITEAKKYFKDEIAFYVDGGKLQSIPSTVVQLFEDGTRMILREGSFKV